MACAAPAAALQVAREDLQASRDARRREQAERRAARQVAKLHNSLRCDARPRVRLAAAEAVASMSPSPTDCCTSSAQNRTTEGAQAGRAGEQSEGPVVVSLFGLDLLEFSLQLLPRSWAKIRSLDLSHNKLSALPGLERLVSLTELDLCRNEFKGLPASLPLLPELAKINISRNDLRPSLDFLKMLLQPPGLPSLEELDLTLNRKCYTQDLADLLRSELPNVAVRMTVTFPPPPGAKVGEGACDRDASLLRSQLEPFTTLQLRRRLVDSFGEEPYQRVGPSPPPRAEVMDHLLERYRMAGIEEERRLVRVNGTPVEKELLDQLLVLLREWAARHEHHQERPNIRAQTYMILRSPTEFEKKLSVGSRRALTAQKKYEQNEKLWNLAKVAMASVDPDFAAKFTGLAVTQGFRGSPHIDTTNTGPFYGLAFGDFADGTGGIRVEVDAMTVAEVNTKGRLGKVDGRFPHWVAPYDEACERFSLIFYQTEGAIVPQSSAVFGTILAG
mmetsp:Transcript_25585/g.71276  ORF Transcript_25585/g.71276 Transcript_25585/m.71276 type:complete len:502 (-) Transcript_25585:178-1683(-)